MTSRGDQVLTTKEGSRASRSQVAHVHGFVALALGVHSLRQVSGAALRFAEQLRIATGGHGPWPLFSPKEKGTSAASPFSPTNTDSHFIFQKKDKTNRKFSAERGATET
jgi:hypothetical protein